jgi:hypothetical protein
VTKDREENNWAKAQDTYKVVQQTIVRGTDLELFGDVERLLPENVQPQCIEMVMEIIPYEREERRRGSSKNSGRSVSSNIKDAFMKRSRLAEDDLETGSPVKKKPKKFVDSESEEDIPPIKRAPTLTKANSRSSASTGFFSARKMLPDVQRSVHKEDIRPLKTQSGLKATTSQKLVDSAEPSSLKAKPAAGTSASVNPYSWLVDESDSDSPNANTKPQDEVIDLTDTEEEEEESDAELEQAHIVSSKIKKAKSPDYEPAHRATSSPDSSFVVPPIRHRRQLDNVADLSLAQDLTFEPARRLKRKDNVTDKALMPPPPLPNSSQGEVTSPPARHPKQIQRSKAQKPSILDGNILLEMEAIHSGDEVDAGSSDSEGIERSSDREFVVDTSATQTDPDYDQSAIYRQGLFTQAPVGGPRFATAPVRNGYLGRGRGNSLGRGHFSSSPSRGSELDTYSLGSFVVDDDDEILEESSQ